MTVRPLPQKEQLTSWSYRIPQPSRTSSTYGFIARRFNSATSRAVSDPRGDVGSDSVSETATDLGYEDRSSRLAALFAVLFVVTLLLAISFITIIAIITDGFSSFNNSTSCELAGEAPVLTVGNASLQNESICMTGNCVRLAANYLNNMNAEVSPCSDFYEFACGRYARQKTVPDHQKKVTVLSEMKKDLDRHLRGLFESSSREKATRPMKLCQIYYDSCMDEDSQEEMSTLPLTSLISQMGGWELLTNARFDSNDYQWETLAGQLAVKGVDGLVRLFVHNSFEDSSQKVLMFSPPRLFLEKKKYYREAPSSNQYLINYRQYIMSLLQMLGVDMEDDTGVIDYQVNDIIDVERRIANMTKIENTRNHTAINNVMTYREFKMRYHQINWEMFFNQELRDHLGILNDNLAVNVVDINYFDALAGLIKSKPLSSINNYLMWSLVSSLDSYLPRRYRKPLAEFRAKLHGETTQAPVWEECVREVRNNLAIPLSTVYAQKYFSIKDREIASSMIVDLKSSMEQTLLNADWIDEETRADALRKLDRMKYKIGFPDSLLNETAVLLPFAGVRLTANQYFENALTLKKTAVREMLSKIHRPSNSQDWASPIIAVDAFHYFTGNEIIFPAGILQYPLFVSEAPFYSNYGSIGMGIGHEITHGYDDLGSQYDEFGNLRSWWKEETMGTFQQKKQCFIQQYSSQTEPFTDRKIDGRMSIGENIADNGGLRVAYQAYKMRISREGEKTVLPGLDNFDNQQLFFLAYANNWCEAVKPSAVDYLMDVDVHSFGMFRVNIPLQNFPSFSKVFNCPIGSPMNPYEKCRIW